MTSQNVETMKASWSMGRLAAGIAAVCVVGSSLLLGGCNDAMKQQNAALLQENTQLRDQYNQCMSTNSELQRQLTTAQGTATQGGGGNAGWNGNSGGGGNSRPASREEVIEIAGDVLFDSGQATLKSGAKKELDTVVSKIKGKHSGRTVKIVGHTDSDPIKKSKWGSNEALSQARADAVREYLVSRGISGGSVTTVGMGAAQPKSSKASSRRVEVVIVDGGY